MKYTKKLAQTGDPVKRHSKIAGSIQQNLPVVGGGSDVGSLPLEIAMGEGYTATEISYRKTSGSLDHY